ncbi:TPA: IS3 family transposase, partial [Streptococcus pyogenes]
PRKTFDKAFKLSAVKLILEEEQPVKMVSSTLEIHPNSLYQWIQEYEKYGESAFPGHGSALRHAQFETKKLEKEHKLLQEELALPKKVPGLFEAKPEIKFQFLKENSVSLNSHHACQTLQVSRSGFYAYLKRRPSSRHVENEALKEMIKAIFYEHKERYGSVRITQELCRRGTHVNHKRVGRLLHQLGLYAKGSRYQYKYYNRRRSSLTRPNLVNQCFQATGKNKLWLGDLTYIPTQEGILYVSVFIDVYSRKIVGWAMGRRMQDKLVTKAFNQAYNREKPKEGGIVHTDQGSQYTGARFQDLLRWKKCKSRMSRKGNPYDNALMEAFYKTLKRELVNDAHFATIEQAQLEIFKYSETYYNPKRLHSALRYLSPVEFEKIVTH